MRSYSTLLALAVLLIPAAQAEPTAAQKSRIERLERSVLAPCCYKEPVSRHNSEISTKIQLEIVRWVTEGKTDKEILDAYVTRYGAEVLTNPDVAAPFWAEWTPWTLTLAGVAGLCALLWRWRKGMAQAQPAVTPENIALPNLSELEDD